MHEIPFNNLEEHIARFSASKKSALITTSNSSGNKHFTFKKSLSLGRNNNRLDKSLCSIENTSQLPCENLPNKNEDKFSIPYPPSESFSKVKNSIVSKKQETISNFFFKRNKVEKPTPQSKPLIDSFRNSLSFLEDDPFADDLNDFDLSSSKIEAEVDFLHPELIPETLLLSEGDPKTGPVNSTSPVKSEESINKTKNTNNHEKVKIFWATVPVPVLAVNRSFEFSPVNQKFVVSGPPALVPGDSPPMTIKDSEVQVMKSSPLLKENHYEDLSVDKIKSIMSSLNEMHHKVMNKVCKVIENDAVLRKNFSLSPLIDIRNTILQRSAAAEKAISTRSETNTTPVSFYSKLCESEEKNVTPKLHKLKTMPLFGSSQNFQETNFKPSSNFQESKYNAQVEKQNSRLKSFKTDFETFKMPLQKESCFNIESVETQMWDLDPEVFNISDDEESMIQASNDNNTLESAKQCDTRAVVAGTFYGDTRDDGATTAFKGHRFSHSERLMEMFQNVFGLQKFRHNQLEAINAALLNEDCFILMPTGGGKSLCYQLPAMVTSGVTIVVSPLRSLIMDQVQKLWSLDIPASSLSGDVDASAMNTVYHQLALKEIGIKLLYVTPEKISASNKLITCIENLYARKMIQRFIIDEAHCVSQWGHDFRPDYKKLKVLREKFPGVPMVALTATATPRVRFDILNQLGMQSPKWFLQSFNRPNLKYEVRPKKFKTLVPDILALIKAKFKNMCGIVYCLSRNDCDSVAKELCDGGIKAISYHAGLGNRNEVQEMWMNDKFKVVCATIAFGMGIDKPDVRFVIHHSIPKSIEGYYQESGRAGRDGELSWCIVYYSYKDMQRIKRMIQQDKANKFSWKTHIDNLFRLVQYCENKTDCRRVQMLEYFGEIFDKRLCSSSHKTACDNCSQKEVFEQCDVTESAKMIIQCVANLVDKKKRQNYTLLYFVDLFKGSKTQKILSAGHDKVPLHGRGINFHRADAERLMRKLVLDGYLSEDLIINKMDLPISYAYLGPRANELMTGKCKVLFSMSKNSKANNFTANANVDIIDDEEMHQLTERCYNELIEVSKEIAAERKMHYTNVINVEALRQMSRELPMTEGDMLTIPHVTRAVYEKYGQKFLQVTEKYGVERCVIDAERADKQMLLAFDDEAIDNWSAGEEESNVRANYNITKKGRKRKKSTAAASQKRFKGYNFKRKFQQGKGKAAKGVAAKSSQFGSNKKNTTKKTASSSFNNTAKVPGFLPMPKLQAKTNQRSFLQAPRVSTF